MSLESTPKLCECGCGEPSPIARTTDPRRGWIRGEPVSFIRYHRNPPLIWSADLYRIEDRGHITPCWIWAKATTGMGYGVFRTSLAHRVSFERAIGPIPDDLELDHLCRQTACIRPAHLEPVTHAENMRRGKQAKVSQREVEQIRKAKGTNAELAARFGLEASYVSRLRRGISRLH